MLISALRLSGMLMRSPAALAAACLLLLSPAAPAVEGAPCPDGSHNTVHVDVKVLAFSGVMKVDPASVTIHLKADAGANRVCWAAVGLLEGYRVQLEGEEETFPLLRGWLTPDQPYTNSGLPVRTGNWVYQATLHRPDAEPLQVQGLSVTIQP